MSDERHPRRARTRTRAHRTRRGGCRRSGRSSGAARRSDRATSSVVGVALLMGITVVSLGVLTAGIGAVVSDSASSVAADRAAADLETTLGAGEAGAHAGEVHFSDGRLRPLDRSVSVSDPDGETVRVAADGLEVVSGDRRAAFVDGGVAVGRPGNARLRSAPSVVVGDDAVLVSVTRVNVTDVPTVAGSGPTTVSLHTEVRHVRTSHDPAEYRLAVETATPGAWERRFADRADVTVLDRRDADGDGVPSVVIELPPGRTLHLVTHEVRVEVTEE